MRLIRICTNYPAYIKDFYKQRPNLDKEPYSIQYQTLMDDCFGWADFWTHAFGKLGYEVWEPVGNAEPMQKKWAEEQGVHYDEKTWLTEIVAAQVKHFQSNILLVNDYSTYTVPFFKSLRQECPSLRCVIGWCGAPYQDETIFNSYDLILSNIPSLVEEFRSLGHHSEYMCHAFEPRILEKIDRAQQPTIPFSFVGSIVKGQGFHNQREILLKTLLEKTDLQIWSSVSQPSQLEQQLLPLKCTLYHTIQGTQKIVPATESVLKKIPKLKTYAALASPPSLSHYVDSAIASCANPPVFGLSMYQTLYNSQVTLNNHIDLASQYASNMRLYEATGVGTCLLTDAQPNLKEVFEPDQEVITYSCPEEAIEKVNYLLKNPEERHKIAKAGQARTLRDHTFVHRAEYIDQLILQKLK
ncbi:MAG: glycosyltransferase [Cyanobacteria bacterium]|jgi:hypothetical protein|nr:glycosyltransferase [Cyanobacteria bacterium GSL.Bin1]